MCVLLLIAKEIVVVLTSVHLLIPSEVKRQKSVPEDLRKAEEDRGSPTDIDIRRPFEEEVCPFFLSY